jgi:hypothetical protein
LPFFDFPFDFNLAPEIPAAELAFNRVTPGANASRGASSGTTKNALISKFGETEADARDEDSAARTAAPWSSVSGSPVGLEELLLGVRSGRETDEHEVGGKDGDGDSSGSILMRDTADDEVDGREIGGGGVGSVVTGLYTEPGGNTGKITPAGTA